MKLLQRLPHRFALWPFVAGKMCVPVRADAAPDDDAAPARVREDLESATAYDDSRLQRMRRLRKT